MKLIHNPRCSKSREALQILKDNKVEPEIILYMADGLSEKELKAVIKKLGIKPEELLRKNEAIFKEKYKAKEFSDDKWIAILSKEPKLIERPIFINKNKAVIGRPPIKVLELL